MGKFELSDTDKEILYFLWDHFDKKGETIRLQEMLYFDTLGREGLHPILDRLRRLDFIDWDTSRFDATVSIEICRPLLDVVHRLKYPPPKDHWKGVVTWFRSKKWSLPFVGFAVLLPLLVQWIEMIQKVLKWFISEK